MNVIEKKKLHQAEFLVEQLVGKLDAEAASWYDLKEPSVVELLDLINDLKLRLGYVLFDLESTRRERDYLAKLVEEFNKE